MRIPFGLVYMALAGIVWLGMFAPAVAAGGLAALAASAAAVMAVNRLHPLDGIIVCDMNDVDNDPPSPPRYTG